MPQAGSAAFPPPSDVQQDEGINQMEMKTQDFQRILEELQPKIGRYNWMWALLRARARQRGGFPWRFYAQLRRMGNPQKPYFIGKTGEGLWFLGDYRDYPSALHAADGDHNYEIIRFMQARYTNIPGAY